MSWVPTVFPYDMVNRVQSQKILYTMVKLQEIWENDLNEYYVPIRFWGWRLLYIDFPKFGLLKSQSNQNSPLKAVPYAYLFVEIDIKNTILIIYCFPQFWGYVNFADIWHRDAARLWEKKYCQVKYKIYTYEVLKHIYYICIIVQWIRTP